MVVLTNLAIRVLGVFLSILHVQGPGQTSRHAELDIRTMIVCALFILKRERRDKGSQGGESVEISRGEEIVEPLQRCLKSTFYFEASRTCLIEEIEKLKEDKIWDKIEETEGMPEDEGDCVST